MTWRYTGTKYGNQKTEIDGHKFDSLHEAERYLILKDMEKKGEIFNLKLQVPYKLIPAQYVPTGEYYKRGVKKGQPKMKLAEKSCSYYADFTYMKNGDIVVEDAKGMKTEAYRIKKKMMLYKYGIQISEV